VPKLLWGAPIPPGLGSARPGDHEAFVIETAGTALLSFEIRMRLTPLPKRTRVCTASDPHNGLRDSIGLFVHGIKALHRSESRLRSIDFK
jgi:hypothetical protein